MAHIRFTGGCPCCESNNVTCSECLDEVGPLSFQVDIPALFAGSANCTGVGCTSVAGSYVTPFLQITDLSTAVPGTNLQCEWELDLGAGFPCAGTTLNGILQVWITAASSPVSHLTRIRLHLAGSTSSQRQIIEWRRGTTTLENCLTFAGTTIRYQTAGISPAYCQVVQVSTNVPPQLPAHLTSVTT